MPECPRDPCWLKSSGASGRREITPIEPTNEVGRLTIFVAPQAKGYNRLFLGKALNHLIEELGLRGPATRRIELPHYPGSSSRKPLD